MKNVLQYNGIQYYISAKIFSPTNNKKYDEIPDKDIEVLIWDNIQKLEFQNDISNTLLFGELIYKDDSNSRINNYLSSTCTHLNITIKKLKNKDNITFDSIVDVDISFNHIFIVTSIDKVSQQNGLIYYSLKFVSTHWWNFNCNVQYSTHSSSYDSKESPVLILQNLYNQCNLNFDLNDVHTNSKVNFISDVDENLYTAQQYLLKRTYNLESLESPGFLKIIYDYINNRYSMWSLRRHSGDSYINEIYPKLSNDEVLRNSIKIQIYNDYIDKMSNQDSSYLDIINFKPLNLDYPNKFNYDYHTYDYEANSFNYKSIFNKEIINSLPSIKNDVFNYAPKHIDISNMISDKLYKGPRVFNRSSSQWDEYHWPYNDIENMLFNNNVIRINTSGNLLRKPGDNTFLSIDSTDYSSLLNLRGDWINLRVVHTFTQTSYRNDIFLNRLNAYIQTKEELIKSKW